jgi:hypothetical protein
MTFPVDLHAMIYMDWSPERKPKDAPAQTAQVDHSMAQ